MVSEDASPRYARTVRGRKLIMRVTALGGTALVFLLLPDGLGAEEAPLIAVLLLLATAAEAVPLSAIYRSLSPGFALAFLVLFLHGPGAAIAISWAAGFLGRIIGGRRTPADSLYHAGRGAVAMAGGIGAYTLAGGTVLSLTGVNWFPLVSVGPAYFLVAFLIDRGFQSPFWPGWHQVAPGLAAHVVLNAFGVFLVLALWELGTVAFALAIATLAPVIFLIWWQERLEMTNDELRILHEAAAELHTSLRLDAVFEVVGTSVRQALGAQVAILALVERDRKGRSCVSTFKAWGLPDDDPAVPAWRALIESLEAEAAGALLHKDLPRERPRVLHDLWPPGMREPRSLLAVPLSVDDQTLGLLLAGDERARRFGPGDLRLLSVLAAQAAGAIRNAVLYETTENMAVTDGLTGLYNYRYLQMRLEDEIRRTKARGSELSLIYIDLDHFKQCNDNHGHLAGDNLLNQFVQVLRNSIRRCDVPVRYAGDEFVVILPDTGVDQASEVVRRLKQAVRRHTFNVPESASTVELDVSVGVACFPMDGLSAEELIRYADRAMYQEKGFAQGEGA